MPNQPTQEQKRQLEMYMAKFISNVLTDYLRGGKLCQAKNLEQFAKHIDRLTGVVMSTIEVNNVPYKGLLELNKYNPDFVAHAIHNIVDGYYAGKGWTYKWRK